MVQILEKSALGLRSAKLVLSSTDNDKGVTLLPVVHVADAQFYETAYSIARHHDIVLIEGVKGPISRNLTRAYRWIDVGRLNLSHQPKFEPLNGNAKLCLRI